MSSSGPGGVAEAEPGVDPEPGPEPDADPAPGADPAPEFDEGAEGVTRAGVPDGEKAGPGARAGGGGEKISGVEGTKVPGAEAESDAEPGGAVAAGSAF
jgi:hypothetical protein